jgi:RNA polymerase sigma-70 factor (ECF subfamily)
MSETSPDEFLGVVREAAPDLLAYFERRVTDRVDAADLLSDVLVQAWRRVDDAPLDPQRGRMWLFGIAHNVLSNHLRGTRRRSALTERLRLHLSTAPPDVDHSDAAAVRDAVQRLPQAQRELVMLVHWDGFSLREAADVLGVNPSTARSRYAAARGSLAASLDDSSLRT